MKRIGLVAVLAVLSLTVPAIRCDGANPVRTPGNPSYSNVSPYLNLMRSGSMTSNYYGLVQPQIGAEAALQRQAAQMRGLQSQLTANREKQDMTFQTGHRTSFQEFSHYYGSTTGRPAPKR
jgi:hypothetical protein